MSNITTTNYFITFLQIVIGPISYLFSSGPTNNISFLFTNNHFSHQQFVKKIIFIAFFIQNIGVRKSFFNKTNLSNCLF